MSKSISQVITENPYSILSGLTLTRPLTHDLVQNRVHCTRTYAFVRIRH